MTNNFHYICSEANPADVLTRGTDFEKLIKNSLWWNGPNLHYLDLSDLQISTFKIITNAHNFETIIDFNRFYSLNKLIRVMSYVIKFTRLIRKLPYQFDFSYIFNTLIILDQKYHFSAERYSLTKAMKIQSFKGLNLCLHQNIICVQTRFLNQCNPPISYTLVQ